MEGFTWKEVCERWQSQPVNEDQWDEMSKEMKDVLEKETEMQKSNPASEELTAEKSKQDINTLSMEELSRELAKCPHPWEHMDAYKILMKTNPTTPLYSNAKQTKNSLILTL
jgi:TRAP-type mannitol/chloroaromatic compound transport system substrate-binding protein